MAISAVNCTLDVRSCCSHSASHRLIPSYPSRIAIFAYSSCIRHPVRGGVLLEYCHDIWCGKLEWWGYRTVKKI